MASLTTLTFQVTVLFAVVYAWFYNGVPGVWKQVSTSDHADEILNRLHLRASASASGGQFENLKEFATVAAVTHTVALLLGFALSGFAANVAHGIAGESPVASLSARFFRRPATRWSAFAICVAVAFVALHGFFRWSFENRVGITYRLAAQFFYEREGSTPFALMSSTSYLMFFAAGFALKQMFLSRDSVEGIFPSVLMRWMPLLVKAFLVAMLVFHFAVMPLYDSVVKPVIKLTASGDSRGDDIMGLSEEKQWTAAGAEPEGEDFTHRFALLASASHTAALALGLLLCWLARLSVRHLHSLRPSSWQQLAAALKGLLSLAAAIGVCSLIFVCVSWHTDLSLDALVFMAKATQDWCWSQAVAVVRLHGVFADKLAAVVGMSSTGGAHPLLLISLALWFAIGLTSEYFINSATSEARTANQESQTATRTRPVFSVGRFKIYPVTKVTADVVAWLLPLGFTLAGLAHQHTALFYDSLIRSFIVLMSTILPGAMLCQAFCMRFGYKIQSEKTAPPMFWQEASDTIGTIFLAACFLAWPVTRHRSGEATALCWSLADTGDSLIYYTVVKLIGGIVIADCWNYWKHRALHWRMLYVFHKDHHSYHDPSCFASFAIHPFEALLTFWQLMLFTLPALKLWGPAHVLVLVLLGINNLYLHCGYAIPIAEKTFPWLLLNTSRFHNVHHEVTRAHFGEVLFIWDWLCGTAIDRRLDDHPVIADMFENAPHAEERREMRRRMDKLRGVGDGNEKSTGDTASPATPTTNKVKAL